MTLTPTPEQIRALVAAHDPRASVLRAANIPARPRVVSNDTTTHATVLFLSEDRALSHGDDPYSLLVEGAPPAALSKLFTNEGRGLADALGSRLEVLGGERSVVSRALTQADREVDALQTRRSTFAQMLTVQAQALVRLYSQEEQLGGSTSILDLFA